MRLFSSATTAACLAICAFSLQADDTFASREHRYQLHVGDVVSVEYRYSPEFNATVSVQPDGYASFPEIGSLKVEGLSLEQAQAVVRAKACERLQDPVITMNLKEFEKPYVVVGGEVSAPGRIEYHGHLTALRAIELAGGLKMSAKASQILLVRQVNSVDAETKVIDLQKVINKHDLAEDAELRAGDLLIVPQSRLAKMERIIKIANIGMYLNPLGY